MKHCVCLWRSEHVRNGTRGDVVQDLQPFKAQWVLNITSGSPLKKSYVLPTQLYFCVVLWIWEQTAIISLYSINWLVCITETECVYCAVRNGSLYIILRSAHTAVFMSFVWIWEQTAIISLYSINWLVCITETKSVYCAVRSGSLYIILHSAHTAVFMCFVWIWEQTEIISLYSINHLALEMDIYSLVHHLYKMWIFYEPRSVTLGHTRHFVEE